MHHNQYIQHLRINNQHVQHKLSIEQQRQHIHSEEGEDNNILRLNNDTNMNDVRNNNIVNNIYNNISRNGNKGNILHKHKRVYPSRTGGTSAHQTSSDFEPHKGTQTGTYMVNLSQKTGVKAAAGRRIIIVPMTEATMFQHVLTMETVSAMVSRCIVMTNTVLRGWYDEAAAICSLQGLQRILLQASSTTLIKMDIQ
jgi:hypothetical protein